MGYEVSDKTNQKCSEMCLQKSKYLYTVFMQNADAIIMYV